MLIDSCVSLNILLRNYMFLYTFHLIWLFITDMACYFMEMTTPKIIFCTKKPVNIILQAIKQKSVSPLIVIFGEHPETISFSDVLKGHSDEEIANFRYLELDNIKKTVCILHSSGTTGMPKGVEYSNYGLINNIIHNNSHMANKTALWYSSIYWISGVLFNLKLIVQNAKAIIYPEFDEEMTCRLIDKYKVGKYNVTGDFSREIIRFICIKRSWMNIHWEKTYREQKNNYLW